MNTFLKRTASASVYALLFVGSIFSGQLLGNYDLGIIILTAFALFVSIGCAFEYYRMAALKGARPFKALGYFYVTVAVLAIGLAPLGSEGGSFNYCGYAFMIVGAIVLFVAMPVALMLQLWRQSEHPFADVLHTLLPVVYCAVPLGIMPIINGMEGVLAMCVFMVWINDSFAYMGGSLVGKHKMWPKHSPGKTWEGTAIGVLAAVAFGVFVGPLFNEFFPIAKWIMLGLACGIIGTLGDLVESMLKRSVGVKDSGNIMPGHGGFLDRFDSLLMILPFALLIAMFLF